MQPSVDGRFLFFYDNELVILSLGALKLVVAGECSFPTRTFRPLFCHCKVFFREPFGLECFCSAWNTVCHNHFDVIFFSFRKNVISEDKVLV